MNNQVEEEVSFGSKLSSFVNRETEDCPVCGSHVEHLVERDGSVHAFPCDCRLWGGGIPSNWWESQHLVK
jgi:hypothetical protein